MRFTGAIDRLLFLTKSRVLDFLLIFLSDTDIILGLFLGESVFLRGELQNYAKIQILSAPSTPRE